MAHQFLSDEWFEAVDAIEAPPAPAAAAGLVINVVVTGADAGDLEIHLDEGSVKRGLADGAPTTITAPYDVVRKLFIERDQAAAMQAFMSGQIKVTGDMTKLMAGGQTPPTPEQEAYAAQILALTVV